MPQSYAELAERFPLEPIRDDDHHDRAIALLDSLLPFEDEDVRAYGEALADLIEAHESATIPLGEVTPGEVLGCLMDIRGMSPDDLAREMGAGEADIAAILGGVRQPTFEETIFLGKFFSVDAKAFMAG